jgi:CBS domain-containing protein
MKIKDVMTMDVRTAKPDERLCDAANKMEEIDSGILPVSDGDRLVGMLTDRDIAIRGVGRGMGPDALVRDVMTHDVKYCFEDDEVDDVADNMAEIQVRRLPVVSRDKRLVGIVSVGDLAVSDGGAVPAGEALRGIARPGGEHRV